MHGNHSEQHRAVDTSQNIINFGATSLFITTVVIIFIAEAMVMMIIFLLGLPPNFSTGIVDATLLSLFVAPVLFFTFLRPMQESLLRRKQSENEQKRLRTINEMKSNFISVVTHELRTPATAIMGYSEMIQKGIHPEEHKEFVELILKKSEDLDRIIDDLEAVNRPEFSKNLDLDLTENNLAETVKQVCTFYMQKHPDIPIQLDLQVSSIMMTYDEVRICQVLENLLSNAIKYSKGSADKIKVSLASHKDHVTIHVYDHGIGMTKGEVESIFDIFYRGEAKKEIVSGLGLGMSIVKNIINSHSGTIDITSKPAVGTEVAVMLPKRCADSPPENQSPADSNDGSDLLQSRAMAMASS